MSLWHYLQWSDLLPIAGIVVITLGIGAVIWWVTGSGDD